MNGFSHILKRLFFALAFYFDRFHFIGDNLKTPKISLLSFIDKKSILNSNSKIYRFCKIKNTSVGSYTYIAPNCVLNNTQIGSFCSVATGVKIGLGMHPTEYVSTSPLFYSMQNALGLSFSKVNKFKEFEATNIGNDVWIGADVIILDGVHIGDGAIVAAKSLVTQDVGSYEIVGGVPARFIKKRFSDEEIEVINGTNWWNWSVEELQKNADYFSDVDLFVKMFRK